MRQQQLQSYKARHYLRLRMIADEPVHIVTTVDNARVDLLADDLGGGGARLRLPKEFAGRFETDRILGPSLLVLPEVGLPIVNPAIRWVSDKSLGVEFLDATENQREMIFKFLFRIERSTARYQVS